MKEKERERDERETPPWNVSHGKYRRSHGTDATEMLVVSDITVKD